jgi:transposase
MIAASLYDSTNTFGQVRSEAVGAPEGPFELASRGLGALPIVCRFLERMRLGPLLERYLPERGARVALPAAAAIGVLVRNLCLARRPLYRLGEWARGFDPAPLGLRPDQLGSLNDDRAGRALERLFACDRASLLTELMVGVVEEFRVDCDQLHNDSTSVALQGAYRGADGRPRAGKPTVAIAHGHSKDHRPDLKQLLWILTVAADGALPLCYRLADGNTNDDKTHTETWDCLRALTGRPDFLYVADCKLASGEQMGHIDAHGGRFVTLLPRGRKEDRALRDLMRARPPRFSEAARRPAARKGDPPEVWRTAPGPIRSTDGFRIVWIHSSQQQRLDEKIRSDRLARAQAALGQLNQRLHGPKCRFAERRTVEAAARAALTKHRCQGLLHTTIGERPAEQITAKIRTPDGATHRRRMLRPRFTLRWQIDRRALAHQAAADGCYALITNDRRLTDPEILAAYRYQPNLEKRHHQLKTVQAAAPVYLKNPARIEALFLCHYIALLAHALIERELRRAMARRQITNLPLYPEQRACRQPTAARTLELFAHLTRHQLTRHGHHIQTFPPQLTPLHTQLLDLLDVPATAYTH